MEAGNPFEGTREEVERAIRRLNMLEYLILTAACVLALVGGALAAYLISVSTPLPFRPTWVGMSLLLLVVPGVIVFGRDRAERDAGPGRDSGPTADNG